MEVLGLSATQVLDIGPSGRHDGKQEESRPMFGWRKSKTGLTKAQLRQAYLERLTEVLGVHENESVASQASRQTPSTKPLTMKAEPELSRT